MSYFIRKEKEFVKKEQMLTLQINYVNNLSSVAFRRILSYLLHNIEKIANDL
jgi:hypothetical protein